MTKTKRERILLGALVVILLLAGWRVWGTLAGSGGPAAATGSGVTAAGGVDTGRFEGIELPSDWADIGEGGSSRDPFQFGGRPAAPPAPPPPPPREPPRDPTPPPPPPPEPVPLTYLGFGRVGGAAAETQAVIRAEDGIAYPVVAGQTLPQERYRVLEVTEDYAVVEDLRSGRTERLLRDGGAQ
jgi:hypothetical protein